MNQSMTFEAQNIIFIEIATFFSHTLWLTKTYKILFQLFCSLLCLPILLLSLSHLYFSIFSLNLNQRDPEFISLNVNFLWIEKSVIIIVNIEGKCWDHITVSLKTNAIYCTFFHILKSVVTCYNWLFRTDCIFLIVFCDIIEPICFHLAHFSTSICQCFRIWLQFLYFLQNYQKCMISVTLGNCHRVVAREILLVLAKYRVLRCDCRQKKDTLHALQCTTWSLIWACFDLCKNEITVFKVMVAENKVLAI